MAHNLEELSEKRRRWVDANRENGFDEGIKRLLTELYPDNAHFIYELLQNAEDAQAQEVRFILCDDCIEFEHDGKKLFSLEDVAAITSIGVSTKRDDTTNIGKFGVGFKAVFAYTNTPQIVSGGFSFQIQEMVVPERINFSSQHDEKTRFMLPFDNPQKSAGRAKNEIETLLRVLDATTLLFLTNIRKIEYLLPDLSLGYIERIDCGNSRFEIRVQQPQEDEFISTYFLVFDNEVQVEDEETDGNGQQLKSCRIAAAFGIAPVEEKKDANLVKGSKAKNKPNWEIVPMTSGSVCIYFPAGKEASNLRFHLHAPFASTVARDSVRDYSGNNALRDHSAELIAESMHKLRDQGLLNVNCLAVLPNDKDNLTTFYKPFLTRLVKEFNEQALVPMKYGGHAAASGTFRGQRALSDLVDDNDLVTLLGDDYSPPMWVANPPQRNQREDNFLSALDIDEWDTYDLASALLEMDDDGRERWMCTKQDVWHQTLYALIKDHAYKLRDIKIVKISDGTYKEGKRCFFPTDDVQYDQTFPRVAKIVYSSGKNYNEDALGFLKGIGVREVDEEVEIENILRIHYAKETPFPNTKEHYRHLRRFIHFLDTNPNKFEMFKYSLVFKITKEKTSSLWVNPAATYLDTPFKDTNLHIYYEQLDGESEKYPLTADYKKSGIKPQKIGDFAEKIGAATNLPIKHILVPFTHPEWDYLNRCGGDRWTSSSRNEDYHIPALDNFFEQPSVSKSALLWRTVKDSCVNAYHWQYTHAQFGRNGSNIAKAKSTLVHSLRDTKWVPQKNDGSIVFVAPCDAMAENLPKGFEYQSEWPWLKELEFGKNIEKIREEQRFERERQTDAYKRKKDVLKEVGFESPEEAIELARLKREDPEGFRKWKDSQRREAAFPARPVANSERRQERLAEQLSNALVKDYEKKERSVRTTNGAIDPITWLRNQYTNEADQMVCQICKEEMPFRKRDGTHYFEKKEILSRKYLSKEHEAQYLALCPLCSAKYSEFVISVDAVLGELKEAILRAEDFEIPIRLGDEEASICFVEAHIHDLKIIIESME